jgi:hypothetical protein
MRRNDVLALVRRVVVVVGIRTELEEAVVSGFFGVGAGATAVCREEGLKEVDRGESRVSTSSEERWEVKATVKGRKGEEKSVFTVAVARSFDTERLPPLPYSFRIDRHIRVASLALHRPNKDGGEISTSSNSHRSPSVRAAALVAVSTTLPSAAPLSLVLSPCCPKTQESLIARKPPLHYSLGKGGG